MKRALEQRLDQVAQRVVHHPVAKRRGADLAPLRLVDEEVAIRAGPIRERCAARLAARSAGRPPDARTPQRLPRRLPRAALRYASHRLSHGDAASWPLEDMVRMPDAKMVIFTRTFDLLTWLLPLCEQFPKESALRRHPAPAGRGARLSGGDLRGQRASGRHAWSACTAADAALNKLRLYLRLAHQWRWLSSGQYQHVSRMVADIGKLLGGWIRQTRTRSPTAAPQAPRKAEGRGGHGGWPDGHQAAPGLVYAPDAGGAPVPPHRVQARRVRRCPSSFASAAHP